MLASVTGSITSLIGDHGVYAVFLLMAIDAVFPAASELVMLYAGALAAAAFSGHHVVLFGGRLSPHAAAHVALAAAGTLGYVRRAFRCVDHAVGALAVVAVAALAGRFVRSSRLRRRAPDSAG